MVRAQRSDQERVAFFPNLNYAGLYHAVSNLIDVFSNVTTGQAGAFVSHVTRGYRRCEWYRFHRP